jgi:hypothetical protein
MSRFPAIAVSPLLAKRVAIIGIVLLVVAVLAVVYNRSLPPKLLQPRLSAVSCRWIGRRVVVSGILYNPNGSSRKVYVSPAFRLVHGATEYALSTFAPRKFLPLARHASVPWVVSLAPQGSDWHRGQAIVRCAASAGNIVAEHD